MIIFKKFNHLFKKRGNNKFSFQIWLLLFIFVALSSLALFRSYYDLNLFSQGYQRQNGQLVKKINEVYGRNGNIESISGNILIVAMDKIDGQGSENVEVEMLPTTEILEIQIPEYLSSQLRQKMADGQDIIARIKSQPEKLYIGQRVLVVSESNMINQKKVTSSRIEYTVIIQTS